LFHQLHDGQIGGYSVCLEGLLSVATGTFQIDDESAFGFDFGRLEVLDATAAEGVSAPSNDGRPQSRRLQYIIVEANGAADHLLGFGG